MNNVTRNVADQIDFLPYTDIRFLLSTDNNRDIMKLLDNETGEKVSNKAPLSVSKVARSGCRASEQSESLPPNHTSQPNILVITDAG
jgi:hypothetical protein